MSPETDTGPRRRTRLRRRRRSPLLFIVLVGAVAVAVVFALANVLDDDRPHGPYLIGAWTFGDDDSLRRAVEALSLIHI